jgi:hypothetical protein
MFHPNAVLVHKVILVTRRRRCPTVLLRDSCASGALIWFRPLFDFRKGDLISWNTVEVVIMVAVDPGFLRNRALMDSICKGSIPDYGGMIGKGEPISYFIMVRAGHVQATRCEKGLQSYPEFKHIAKLGEVNRCSLPALQLPNKIIEIIGSLCS